MLRIFATTIVVICFFIFVFFAFFWNDVAVGVANSNLESTGMRIENGFRGAFPLNFQMPRMTIIPGQVTLKDTQFKYDGTYNPFHIMSQHGHIMHGKGLAEIDILGRTTEISMNRFNIDRNYKKHWIVTSSLDIMGVDVDLRAEISLNENEMSSLMLRGMNVTVDCTEESLRAMYKDHQLLDLLLTQTSVENVEDFKLMLGTILDLRGTLVRKEEEAGIYNAHYAFYQHSLQPTFDSLRVQWQPTGPFDINIGKTLHIRISDGNVIVGSYKSPTADHTFQMTRIVPRSGVSKNILKFTPALNTPLGKITHISTERQALLIHIGHIPFIITQKSIRYGPIGLFLTPERIALEIDGGHFDSFRCTYLHAFLSFNEPDLLVLQNATGHQWGEIVSGSGSYNIATRRADVSVKLA